MEKERDRDKESRRDKVLSGLETWTIPFNPLYTAHGSLSQCSVIAILSGLKNEAFFISLFYDWMSREDTGNQKRSVNSPDDQFAIQLSKTYISLLFL